MLAIDSLLARVMTIPGAQSATLVDHTSGLAVAAAGREDLVNQHEDAAGTTEIARAVLLRSTRNGEDIDDIIVSGAHGHQLLTFIRPVFDGRLFLHLRIGAEKGNLALARLRVRELVREATES